ncbi:MAG: glutaredoxin family protein [Candidatus Dormibacteria bacterium]
MAIPNTSAVAPVRLLLVVAPDCGFCGHAKTVLSRVVADFPCALEELDLTTSDGRALADTVRLPFPPGMWVDGHFFGYGRISERKLRTHLAGLLTSPGGPRP